MKIQFGLYGEAEEKLKAYREKRRQERGGKVLQVETALRELIDKALAGIEPPKVVDLEDMERRISRLEEKILA